MEQGVITIKSDDLSEESGSVMKGNLPKEKMEERKFYKKGAGDKKGKRG